MLLARTIRLHPSLDELGIVSLPLDTPAALDTLVDAAIAGGLTGFYLLDCRLGPQSATYQGDAG